MQLFFPTIALQEADAALPEIALYVGGKLFQSVFLYHVCKYARFRPGLTRQRLRLLYVMGRDNVFPERVFGYVHRNGVLALNVIMVGIVGAGGPVL